MNGSSLNVPDDWLALAWCALTMGLSLLLIYLAGLFRRHPAPPDPAARRLRPQAEPNVNVTLWSRPPLPPGLAIRATSHRFLHRSLARPRLSRRRRFDI